MTEMKYNLIVLIGFLTAAIVEFVVRNGGGFTITAFIFYGIFHLIRTGMFLIKIDEDDKNRKN